MFLILRQARGELQESIVPESFSKPGRDFRLLEYLQRCLELAPVLKVLNRSRSREVGHQVEFGKLKELYLWRFIALRCFLDLHILTDVTYSIALEPVRAAAYDTPEGTIPHISRKDKQLSTNTTNRKGLRSYVIRSIGCRWRSLGLGDDALSEMV